MEPYELSGYLGIIIIWKKGKYSYSILWWCIRISGNLAPNWIIRIEAAPIIKGLLLLPKRKFVAIVGFAGVEKNGIVAMYVILAEKKTKHLIIIVGYKSI